jgi:hypothetical protein
VVLILMEDNEETEEDELAVEGGGVIEGAADDVIEEAATEASVEERAAEVGEAVWAITGLAMTRKRETKRVYSILGDAIVEGRKRVEVGGKRSC